MAATCAVSAKVEKENVRFELLKKSGHIAQKSCRIGADAMAKDYGSCRGFLGRHEPAVQRQAISRRKFNRLEWSSPVQGGLGVGHFESVDENGADRVGNCNCEQQGE